MPAHVIEMDGEPNIGMIWKNVAWMICMKREGYKKDFTLFGFYMYITARATKGHVLQCNNARKDACHILVNALFPLLRLITECKPVKLTTASLLKACLNQLMLNVLSRMLFLPVAYLVLIEPL